MPSLSSSAGSQFFAVAYMDGAAIALVYQTLVDAELTYLRLAKNTRDKALKFGYIKLADRANKTLQRFERELQKVSVDVAAQSERIIRSNIRRTQVRPPSGRSPRLVDLIKSIPVPFSPNIGFVGMAEIASLDQAVNPFDRSAQPFWKAQEYGLDAGFVGRQIRGFFFGDVGAAGARTGGAPPDPGQFRQHPVFRAGAGAKMTINRPIKERRFLRDGTAVAGAEWMRRYKAAERNILLPGLRSL